MFTSTYRQGQVAGQGYIGLATNIFGNWNPLGVLRGALLFGFPTALKYRDENNIPALFLVAAIVLFLAVVVMVLKKRLNAALVCGSLTALAMYAYIVIDKVPQDWVAATPYIVTLVVLAGARQQLRPPAHAGIPYRTGESH